MSLRLAYLRVTSAAALLRRQYQRANGPADPGLQPAADTLQRASGDQMHDALRWLWRL